jgi:hypothetical protein
MTVTTSSPCGAGEADAELRRVYRRPTTGCRTDRRRRDEGDQEKRPAAPSPGGCRVDRERPADDDEEQRRQLRVRLWTADPRLAVVARALEVSFECAESIPYNLTRPCR